MTVISIEGVENVRDLGGILVSNGMRCVKSGLLYRGANLANLTDEGARFMADELGISLVVDLRVGWEVEENPDRPIPRAQNVHLPFYDKEKVGIEYNERAQGTQVVGRDIACDPNHLYRHMSNELTARQMGKTVRLMLSRALEGKPSYVHCSGGKDRAGIIALCLLTILGASEQAILDDYLLTNVSREAHINETFQRFLRLAGGNEEKAWAITHNHAARPENLKAFRESVCQRYGSMDAFVSDMLGISPEFAARVQNELTEPVREKKFRIIS